MAAIFDPTSIPTAFANKESVSQLFEDAALMANGSDNMEAGIKKHAACDECRQRKLKCSGERSGCARCVKHGIVCHYSDQKQMGRPRKRQRTEDDITNGSEQTAKQTQPLSRSEQSLRFENLSAYPILPDEPRELPIDPTLNVVNCQQTRFENVCSGPIAQTIRDANGASVKRQQIAHFHDQLLCTNADCAASYEASQAEYPLDFAEWPDFSNTSLPMPLMVGSETISDPRQGERVASTLGDSTYSDPDIDPSALSELSASPACPCLPNLYLTLSTMSTLSSFPVSNHTIDTLTAAHRTAYSVIYCPICPGTFQTGAQNLMLSCTLLNVLGDHWHRVRIATADDLKKGFTSASRMKDSVSSAHPSMKEGVAWRQFSSDLICAYVFGDKPIPELPTNTSVFTQTATPETSSTSTSPSSLPERYFSKELTLNGIVQALIRRQRQWHNLDEPTDEFPDRCENGYSHLYQNPLHKWSHQHDPPRKSSQNSTNEDLDNDTRAGDEANAKDNADPKVASHKHKKDDVHDNMLCLTIVRHSQFLLQLLDKLSGHTHDLFSMEGKSLTADQPGHSASHNNDVGDHGPEGTTDATPAVKT